MLLQYMNHQNATILIISAIVMIMALIFHNMAQAFVATRFGDSSAKFGGYLRFEPQQHLEPMGVLFLFLLGFGWPKPIPVNSRNYRGKQEAWVWYAGPALYLLVAFVSFLAAVLLFRFGGGDAAAGFQVAGLIAIRHAVINLFPVFPLDGARAALVWGDRGVRNFIQTVAQYGFIGFIVIFMLLSFSGILGAIERFFAGLILSVLQIFL